MSKAFVGAIALLAPASALAWEHTGGAWLPEDLPLPYEISTYVEDSIPEGYAVTAIQSAYHAWDDAECADISAEFVGMTDANTSFVYDFKNRHSFDDPGDTLAPGILAATLSRPVGTGGAVAFVKNGRTYTHQLDSDIVFNDNVDWATDEDIRAGVCNAEHSIRSVAVHEIGHQYGLAHSCEQEDVCNDPELREATMYWSDDACSLDQGDINIDDIRSISALYGPSASFACSHELAPGTSDTIAVGNVPMTVKCVMKSDNPDEVTGATWYFGDGKTETGTEVKHTYEEAGNYTVRACFDGNRPSCGDWTFCNRREGYVRACATPAPEFTVSHVNGLTYEFLNDTDLTVYGCIFEVQWDIFQGDSTEPIASVKSWEPRYTFPATGEYRVVLNVGGPAGTGAAEAVFDAKNRVGEGYGGCSSAPVGGGAGAGVLALLGLLGLRRRTGAA